MLQTPSAQTIDAARGQQPDPQAELDDREDRVEGGRVGGDEGVGRAYDVGDHVRAARDHGVEDVVGEPGSEHRGLGLKQPVEEPDGPEGAAHVESSDHQRVPSRMGAGPGVARGRRRVQTMGTAQLAEKYRNRLDGMMPVVSFLFTCCCKKLNERCALMAFHSARLVTPITSTFHHSA